LIAIPEVARQLGSSREHFGLSHFLIATGEVNWQLEGGREEALGPSEEMTSGCPS